MELRRILLPIDVARCPIGVFDLVNRLRRGSDATVTLLHVVTLNIAAAENRIYEELGREALSYLEKLASRHLRGNVSTLVRVRRGRLAEEILAQAKADRPDLIVLPVHRVRSRKGFAFHVSGRPKAPVSALARRIIRAAGCDVLVAPFPHSLQLRARVGPAGNTRRQ